MHDPEWPDKAMYAAYLLLLGGALGLAVEGLRLVAAVDDHLPEGLTEAYPPFLGAGLAASTLVLGFLCLRRQAAVFGYLGAATGLGSLSYSGLVPFLSLVAIAMLILSRREGEKTRRGGVPMHADLWPDKAMSASLFAVVGGSIVLVQGILVAFDRYQPILLRDLSILAAILDIGAGLFCLWAGFRIYFLKSSWSGNVAALLLLLTAGLYVLGPLFAVMVFTFMRKAEQENEFTKHAS